ncbi:MAG: FAD synthase [Candidatus Pacebacteria bacterium]|nr:FAD synthase [Candidatus Paceibacterota bacterium]
MTQPKSKIMKKIMVFGTFDGLHPGHINFFRQAKRLATGSVLVVSIARDSNVRKIKKYTPIHPESDRMKIVIESGLADRVILGGVRNHLTHILKERPDIIALGYDQVEYVKNIKTELAKMGLKVKIVRLKPYKEKVYKNKFIQNRK